MTRPIFEVVAAWEAAETRLYPVVLTRPEAYARYLELVRTISDDLALYGTVEALVEAFERAAEIAAAGVERSGVGTENLDVGLAAGAAFALRYRKVMASTARREALSRIAEAWERGDPWVTVSESGDAMGGPYVRLDLHLADGASVRASIGFDAETGEPRYVVEAFRADPRTGDRLEGVAEVAPPSEFRERAAWERALDQLRSAIDGGSV